MQNEFLWVFLIFIANAHSVSTPSCAGKLKSITGLHCALLQINLFLYCTHEHDRYIHGNAESDSLHHT